MRKPLTVSPLTASVLEEVAGPSQWLGAAKVCAGVVGVGVLAGLGLISSCLWYVGSRLVCETALGPKSKSGYTISTRRFSAQALSSWPSAFGFSDPKLTVSICLSGTPSRVNVRLTESARRP